MIKSISSEELELKLNFALKNLLLLFNVSDDELKKFKPYHLVRELKREEKSPWKVSGYDFNDLRMYFPPINGFNELSGCEVFDEGTIHHEMSHYIHHMINFPNMQWSVEKWKTLNDMHERYKVREIIAYCGPIILNLYSEKNMKELARLLNLNIPAIQKIGRSLLPRIARMTFDEINDSKYINSLVNFP